MASSSFVDETSAEHSKAGGGLDGLRQARHLHNVLLQSWSLLLS